jgi:hypothetical protein
MAPGAWRDRDPLSADLRRALGEVEIGRFLQP